MPAGVIYTQLNEVTTCYITVTDRLNASVLILYVKLLSRSSITIAKEMIN